MSSTQQSSAGSPSLPTQLSRLQLLILVENPLAMEFAQSWREAYPEAGIHILMDPKQGLALPENAQAMLPHAWPEDQDFSESLSKIDLVVLPSLASAAANALWAQAQNKKVWISILEEPSTGDILIGWKAKVKGRLRPLKDKMKALDEWVVSWMEEKAQSLEKLGYPSLRK
ncbi:MAG: hypothetical protein AAFR61_01165 [Bacteroidota bacterium]